LLIAVLVVIFTKLAPTNPNWDDTENRL